MDELLKERALEIDAELVRVTKEVSSNNSIQLPIDMKDNPINNGTVWVQMNKESAKDPANLYQSIIFQTIHCYNKDRKAWLKKDRYGRWQGSRMVDLSPITLDDWVPWDESIDNKQSPCIKWFKGALTNAAFNEVDRHVIGGQANEVAFLYENEDWDKSAYRGLGKPVEEETLTRKELLIKSAIYAYSLKKIGVKKGDRIVIVLPNNLEQIIWIEAIKRVGAVYCCIDVGYSPNTIADRITELNACMVITCNGSTNHANVVSYKTKVIDPALKNFIPSRDVIAKVDAIVSKRCSSVIASKVNISIIDSLRDKFTADIAFVIKLVAKIISEEHGLEAKDISSLRQDLFNELNTIKSSVKHVIVHNIIPKDELPCYMQEGRDFYWNEYFTETSKLFCNDLGINSVQTLRDMASQELVLAINDISPCEILDINYPMMVCYPEDSNTPKPIVHSHGGFVVGACYSLRAVFDAVPGRDILYSLFKPSQIAYQSYVISAALAHRIPAVINEGSFVFPDYGRFASIINRRQVTIVIAPDSFITPFIFDPKKQSKIEKYDLSSLRLGAVCADKTCDNEVSFASEYITKYFINAFITPETGSIVWGHFYGNPDFRIKDKSKIYPFPWVAPEVRIPASEPDKKGRYKYRVADKNEKGELFLKENSPFSMLTTMGGGDDINSASWSGDLIKFSSAYFSRNIDSDGNTVPGLCLNSDTCVFEDNTFNFYLTDNLNINIQGNIFSAIDIERCVLKDKYTNTDSPLEDILVTSIPDRERGNVSLAFVILKPGKQLLSYEVSRIKDSIENELGELAVPRAFIVVNEIPILLNGRYNRQVINDLISSCFTGASINDCLSLIDSKSTVNPTSIEHFIDSFVTWKNQNYTDLDHEFELSENGKFLKIQYYYLNDAYGEPATIATITLISSPVNALSTPLLNELIKVIGSLEKRKDIKAIVISSAFKKYFVAGADITEIYRTLTDRKKAKEFAAKGHALFSRIEKLQIPVIAAISGLCLGGGSELAMACHYRVGDLTTVMGQPEIKLYVPPGFGGTQRLPRIITSSSNSFEEGVNKAMIALLSGRQMYIDELTENGLINEVADGYLDVTSRANQLAIECIIGKNDAVLEAMRSRHKDLSDWDRPIPVPWSVIIENPEVQRCLRQSVSVGRGKVANAIVKLVQIGFEQGYTTGLLAEAEAFAAAAVDEENGGRKGLPLFFQNKSPRLPCNPRQIFLPNQVEKLISKNELLAIGSSFFPGRDQLPKLQLSYSVIKNFETGIPEHGAPNKFQKEIVIPIKEPKNDELQLYVLASGIDEENVNILSGIPRTVFDQHDKDIHVLGDSCVGLIIGVGNSPKVNENFKIGDVVCYYSNILDQRNKNSLEQDGFSVMEQSNSGGTHQQFVAVDPDKCIKSSSGLTYLNELGAFVNGGTAYRALFSTLKVKPKKRILIENALSGVDAWSVQLSLNHNMSVTGIVSDSELLNQLEKQDVIGINANDLTIYDSFTRVPKEDSEWRKWFHAGDALISKIRDANNGELMDYAISSEGERSFPRSFQSLAIGGKIAVIGTNNGVNMTFIAKPGEISPSEITNFADVDMSKNILLYYGLNGDKTNNSFRSGLDKKELHQNDLVDEIALETIDILLEQKARLTVITQTEDQLIYLKTIGFDAEVLAGIVSIEAISQSNKLFSLESGGIDFLPDPLLNPDKYREGVVKYTNSQFKPLQKAISKATGIKNYRADYVIDRSFKDTIGVSLMLCKPLSGKVLILGNPGGKRFSFYSPQLVNMQREVVMGGAKIIGTRHFTKNDSMQLFKLIRFSNINIPKTYYGSWHEAVNLYQSVFDGKLSESINGAASAIINHAIPEEDIANLDHLLHSWFNQNLMG